MTRPDNIFVLRRAYEKLVASVGALALTALLLVSVEASAAQPLDAGVTPSVSILVPTVTIEAVEEPTSDGVRG